MVPATFSTGSFRRPFCDSRFGFLALLLTATVLVGTACGPRQTQFEVSGQSYLPVVGSSSRTIVGLALSIPEVQLRPGEIRPLSLTVHYEDGSHRDVSDQAVWSLSDEEVVEITDTWPARIRALAPGRCEISASYKDKVSGNVSVEVLTRWPESIVLRGPGRLVPPGERFALTALATYSDGEQIDISEHAQWHHARPGIIDLDGPVLTALQDGVTTVTASLDGVTSDALGVFVGSRSDVEQIEPGPGFSGPTAQPPVVGAGTDAKAIARWDVVPFQTVREDFFVGVVAFHLKGIDRVEMSAAGGPWVSVREMRPNPRTGVWEYFANLSVRKFRAGPIELRAVVYPEEGTPRVLDPLQLYVDPYEFSPELERYVSPRGSDETGNGSREAPFATLMRAALAIQEESPNGTADGGRILLLPGNHHYGSHSSARPVTEYRYVRILPAPGVSRDEVTIATGASKGLYTKLVRISNVRISSFLSTKTDFEDYLWLDGCHLVGDGPWTNISNLGFVAGAKWTGYYGTDCILSNNRHGMTQATLLRNVHIANIGSDAFKNSQCLINCSVDGIDRGDTQWHPDILQFTYPVENLIVYGLRARNIRSQGIFSSFAPHMDNVAFVNVFVHMPADAGYFTQWKVRSKHFLLWQSTFVNQLFFWRVGLRDSIQDVSIRNNVFRFKGAVRESWLDNNHFHPFRGNDVTSPGTRYTFGLQQYLAEDREDYRPAPGSPLIRRVQDVLVPIDCRGNLLRVPAAVGALQPTD